jgi:hypothetical protein
VQTCKIYPSAGGKAKDETAAALYRHNVEMTATDDRRPIGAELRDGVGQSRGGLWGQTELGLLVLDMFLLPEHVRGRSCGTKLLAVTGNEAIHRGSRRAVVETSSFHAPGFNLRHGYREFGRVDFGIGGHCRVFLQKELSSATRRLERRRSRTASVGQWPQSLENAEQ